MKRIKFWQLFPFLIIAAIVAYTWYIFSITDHFVRNTHKIAAVLIIINAILYFFYFKVAVILTGIILIAATFNIVALFPDIVTTSYFVKIGNTEVSTPDIQWKSALILTLFIIINIIVYPIGAGGRKGSS